MSQKERTIQFSKYRKKPKMNIGVFLFGIIGIYLVVTVAIYMTAGHITMYEVGQGSIVLNTTYTGVAVREEITVYSEESGYLNYFQTEGSKVAAKERLYVISAGSLDLSQATDSTEEALTLEKQEEIGSQINSFVAGNNSSEFQDTYDLHYQLKSILSRSSTQDIGERLDAIAATESGVSLYYAPRDGIVSYHLDSLDGLTVEQVGEDTFAQEQYDSRNTRDVKEITEGEGVYKLITSEDWNILFPLEEEGTLDLEEGSSLQVRLKEDNELLWAEYSSLEVDGKQFGCLTFHDSMVRYMSSRFLDIDLVLENQSGLKIPVSSVLEKEFYIVPYAYITRGGNTRNNGVLVQNKEGEATFENVTIYYYDTERDLVYLSTTEMESGAVLQKPDADETYELSQTEMLTGVYNIDKGYTQFQYVNILAESDGYYIVEEGSSYGPVNYDHIVLDVEKVQEKQIVK